MSCLVKYEHRLLFQDEEDGEEEDDEDGDTDSSADSEHDVIRPQQPEQVYCYKLLVCFHLFIHTTIIANKFNVKIKNDVYGMVQKGDQS